LTLDEIAERVAGEDFSFLQPLELGTGDLPKIELTAEQFEEVRHGRFIPIENAETVLAGFHKGKLIAILEKREETYKPRKVFL
jgi:tRNA pseudouridine synthase B